MTTKKCILVVTGAHVADNTDTPLPTAPKATIWPVSANLGCRNGPRVEVSTYWPQILRLVQICPYFGASPPEKTRHPELGPAGMGPLKLPSLAAPDSGSALGVL